jgi:hypothetical protein
MIQTLSTWEVVEVDAALGHDTTLATRRPISRGLTLLALVVAICGLEGHLGYA